MKKHNDAVVTLGTVKSLHSYHFKQNEWLKELATFLTMCLAIICWGAVIIGISA